MKRIAIFASGAGSNAENIISHFQSGCRGGEVVLVVCNRPGAGVLVRAGRLGVDAKVLSRAEINDEAVMQGLLDSYKVDVIVLAGFLLMVPEFLLKRYDGRIVNIHPSLLPKYGGKGMYGRHVHEAVVAAGEKETGITIHHVTETCDGGDVIFQASVRLEPTDGPEEVEAKVHGLEREHFARVIEETFCR
ncbi:MAG: phosphoribosylglycinamide formyltransferase [Staphylococcus sp.]|nr:phosphoribosylglycinamide formyltransferase [Staphylococcus sp.]